MDDRPVEFISMSGGRTSAYMTARLLREEPHKRFIVTFANTGREHPATLKFIRRCDEHFGFGTVWLEAVVSMQPGVGTGFRIVDYTTADRDGKVFEDEIRKYGLPNLTWKHCTRVLKAECMNAYRRSIDPLCGGIAIAKPGQVLTPVCVGIRADEPKRISKKAMLKAIRYPLVEWGVVKQDVLDWWADQPFDL